MQVFTKSINITSRAICSILLLVVAVTTSNAQGLSQNQQQLPGGIERSHWEGQTNTGTVRIITKGLGCTCTNFASDMSKVLNNIGKMRILPVLGTGSLQGIADVLYLKGIDLSILQSDVFAYVKRNKIHSNIEHRLRYVTKLHASELHLIAGKGINSIEDLEGKTVSFDAKGRGSFITAQNVFAGLGINVKSVRLERDRSIQKVRTGELAAAFVVTGRPAGSMRKVKAGDGLHFLPVPYHRSLVDTYLPSKLTHNDYPNLIPKGQTIPTIAVSEVLAVYNWKPGSKRYNKTAAFIEAFFDNFETFLQPTYHKKWKQVSLTANVPGWKRFPAATEKLRRMRLSAGKRNNRGNSGMSRLESDFNEFLQNHPKGAELSAVAKRELYESFRKWRQQRK